MFPASTTKIMTLMLALESGISLDTVVTIPEEVKDVPEGSSVVPVYAGENMTFRDLLYGLMLRSGNDGAIAIAVIVEGDTPDESYAGGAYAAPVARAILQKWLEKKQRPAEAPKEPLFKPVLSQ